VTSNVRVVAGSEPRDERERPAEAGGFSDEVERAGFFHVDS
jgi:hypothetical protein